VAIMILTLMILKVTHDTLVVTVRGAGQSKSFGRYWNLTGGYCIHAHT
jgi:hypothetical protein